MVRVLTFIWISRAKSLRDCGWSKSIPWIKSNVERIKRLFWPSRLCVSVPVPDRFLETILFVLPRRRSKHDINRMVTRFRERTNNQCCPGLVSREVHLPFHSKPLCSRRNSLKAASFGRLVTPTTEELAALAILAPLFDGVEGDWRHIFARNPSRHRRPFRIWIGS